MSMNRNHTLPLTTIDPEIAHLVKDEEARQQNHLELIASENIASRAVKEAMATALTDKYAEGYPGKRYYGGCHVVDKVENIAIERVKSIYGAQHANVQPHSGSQANMAVLFAFLKPGDTILTMDLSHGGHLTHGSKVNFSGNFFNVIHYGVNKESELIDYNHVESLAKEHKPKMIISGASAYPRVIDFQKFGEIADSIGAYHLCDMAHYSGLIAAGEYPNPVPYAHFVTSTTHKSIRGPRGGMILCKEEYAKQIDKSIFPGIQGGPLMHIIAAKAVCFKESMEPEFKEYQKQVKANAKKLATCLANEGLRIVSGGTDSHLILIDVKSVGINGKEAQAVLDSVNITTNKNTIPFDIEKPMVTSGIRIGTPALTTRGMKEAEMETVSRLIYKALSNKDNSIVLEQIKQEVIALCSNFPIQSNVQSGMLI